MHFYNYVNIDIMLDGEVVVCEERVLYNVVPGIELEHHWCCYWCTMPLTWNTQRWAKDLTFLGLVLFDIVSKKILNTKLVISL